jgi:hypothetical protein
MDPYLQAIQAKVCPVCIDRNMDGGCSLSETRTCAVEMYLPQIINAVRQVKSRKVEDYVEKLREEVCSSCRYESPDGKCKLRVDLNCGLDRYFPIVVQAIESIDGTKVN